MCDEVKGLRVSRLHDSVWPVPFYQCPSHSVSRNIVFIPSFVALYVLHRRVSQLHLTVHK